MNSVNHDRHLIEASKLEFSKKCRRVSLKNIPSGVLNQVGSVSLMCIILEVVFNF